MLGDMKCDTGQQMPRLICYISIKKSIKNNIITIMAEQPVHFRYPIADTGEQNKRAYVGLMHEKQGAR